MRFGRLLLRATVGAFFIGHGTQKLFGSFGGPGLKATADGFEEMGLKPGKVHASAAGAAETIGGAGILLGYHTPVAAASIIGVMSTAIDRVHLENGPWVTEGGYEYNAVLIAAAATLAEIGPGALSLDALRGKERSGARWSLFALAAGVAGAAGLRAFADMQADKSAGFPPSAASAPPVTPAPEQPLASVPPVAAVPDPPTAAPEAEESAGDATDGDDSSDEA